MEPVASPLMRRPTPVSQQIQASLHTIVTYGEDPVLTDERDQAWVSHLEYFLDDYGHRAWLVELIRGAIGHLWWRITASTQRSSLSTGFAAIGAAIASFGLMTAGYEDFLSVAAEVHSAVGLLAIGVAFAWKPWTLSSSHISPASFVASTGLAHLAASSILFVWFDYLHVAGLATAALGLFYISVSGRRSGLPLGRSRLGLWLIFGGALSIGIAQMLWALAPTDPAYASFSAITAFASAVAGLRILDLWAMQDPSGTIGRRLLGAGRRRQRPTTTSLRRSPLSLARSSI